MSKTESHSRLSGRLSAPSESGKAGHVPKDTQPPAIRRSSKPFHLTGRATEVSIRCYHRISTCFQPLLLQSSWPFRHLLGKPAARESTLVARSHFSARSRTTSSVWLNTGRTDWLGQSSSGRHGRQSFLKDLLEVLAKALKPFEERCPRIQPRGRGEFLVLNIRCRTSVGRPKIKRPAKATLSLDVFIFIPLSNNRCKDLVRIC